MSEEARVTQSRCEGSTGGDLDFGTSIANHFQRRISFASPADLGGKWRAFPMLPPFIIEQIRKREEESKRGRQEQPQLDIPIERPRPATPQADSEGDEPERGVVIVQL